jgi:asparagine synthase (glutamine-hydrolysing)
VTFAAFREIPWSLFGTMAAARSQVALRTPYLDNTLVALAYRAPASVRASADSALRLVRDVQPRLGEIATDRGVLAGRAGVGYGLARLWAEVAFKLDYMHNEGLPSSLRALAWPLAALDRAGFLGPHRYLPYRLWFRHDLARYIAEVMGDPAASRLPFWNVRGLSDVARDHVAGRRSAVREINAVLTLEAVDRLLIRGGGWAA